MIHKPYRVGTYLILIPRSSYEIHKFLTLTSGVMLLNGIAFLNAFSSKTIFFAFEQIPFFASAQLSSSLKKIVNIYARECFTIRVIFMDMEFEKVSDDMELVKLNTTAAR